MHRLGEMRMLVSSSWFFLSQLLLLITNIRQFFCLANPWPPLALQHSPYFTSTQPSSTGKSPSHQGKLTYTGCRPSSTRDIVPFEYDCFSLCVPDWQPEQGHDTTLSMLLLVLARIGYPLVYPKTTSGIDTFFHNYPLSCQCWITTPHAHLTRRRTHFQLW